MDQLAKRNDGGLANETTTDYNKEYLHDLIITSSAFIGNLISAIAVYYFIRSFLLGKELWQRRRKREERGWCCTGYRSIIFSYFHSFISLCWILERISIVYYSY